MIAANGFANESPGAAKRGLGLLTGLLRCRRCGRNLTVQHRGSVKRFLRYGCRRGQLDQGEPRCIAFGGLVVDDAIAREIVRVVQPSAQQATVLASQQVDRRQDEVRAALERDLEAVRYEAKRAQKQYDAVDPENRLVADELERRWMSSLFRPRNQATEKDGQGLLLPFPGAHSSSMRTVAEDEGGATARFHPRNKGAATSRPP